MRNTSLGGFKKIKSDFTATLNPFNQNLNYEKILRFSNTKILFILAHTSISGLFCNN